ncbi:hypothetical protein LAZ67_18000682 [Cordylochernes scorpioides]|uniref:Reverse transcriptase zinc-binding domain-containing protein n=1 Tax=Cordylochernes scorpioides TaxID=51811 RepID=A0ABY6LF27_9ARAC|nr:hypothetical protein LAZ67_18000682 [Cordylochernes scorpioides]
MDLSAFRAAQLARFVWGTSRVSWLPGGILARPVSDGGVGLLDIAGQLRLACLKGVQASLCGAANGYSWLVRSRAWLTSPAPDVWHSPRRRRLLSLWEAASSVLELDHRVLHPASLRSLRLRGDNRFLRPPDLLVPERWLQATVGDFSDGAPALARSTRAALLDAQHLGAFCQRLLRENASSSYHMEYEAEPIVLRGSATPITRLPSQRARRALDSARLQAHPTAELAARWTLTVDVPRSIPWADLRRNCFSGHDADVALRLALHALSHPDHPASRRAKCAACGSSNGSLTHRYWSCRAVRPLLQEVFASCDLPLDLQAWLFGVGLHPEAVKLTSVAKATIYKYHLGLEVDNASQHLDLPTLWERTLAARLARFVWGTNRVSWLPGRILARPVSDGGVGLLDIAGQLRLACLKGVQASLCGAANGYSWLVRSRAWLTPPDPDVWHSPRRRRLLCLWEAASSSLELDHRVLHPASLRSLRLRNDNRFLRPPDLLAPERWLQATVGDFSDCAPALAR